MINSTRTCSSVIIALLLAVLTLLPGGSVAAQPQAQSDARCFGETGHCISGRIRAFWEQNGGLPIFGMPISPLQEQVIEGRTIQVQWFERNRLELHPENPPPFDVLLGRLGADVLEQQGRNWYAFPKRPPQDGCRYFVETGHNICGNILAAWRASGLELDGQPGTSETESLALFGMPLSSAQNEKLADGRQYTVQWFERGRFELHPENPPNAQVLLGLLGSELQGIPMGSPVPASTVTFEPGSCPFGVPGGMRVECGTLVVPENRRNPAEGGLVRLAVAVVRNSRQNPPPDPVLYLSGGPGSPALGNTITFARAWSSFIGNRDFIVYDQRGTGRSRPSLRCPEIGDVGDQVIAQNLSRADKVRAEADALRRCGDRLRSEGVDLANYSSAASAADINDLRSALGYERLNIFGISYGTRLALTVVRDYPSIVRTIALDSVYPPQANLFTAMPPTIDGAFARIFVRCAADPTCNRRYPDLENVFYNLVNQMNATPLVIDVQHPRTGARVQKTVTGDDLIDTMFRATYRTAELPRLPGFIYDTRNGNYGTLSRLESDRLGRMFGGSFSQGMYFAVQCNEEILFETPQSMRAAADAYPRLRNFFAGVLEFTDEVYGLCAHYGIRNTDPRENEAITSDIPALMLAGENDPITPPHWAPLTAETFSRSYVYEFPGTGHAVISRGACPAGLLRSFLNDPFRAPDGSCVR